MAASGFVRLLDSPRSSLLKYSIQVPQITMLDFLFSCLVGTGIGAYNSASIKPCLSDTVKMIKQKADPYVQQVVAKAKELTGRK